MVASNVHLNKLSHIDCDEKINGKTTYLNISFGPKETVVISIRLIPLNRAKSKDDGPESFV